MAIRTIRVDEDEILRKRSKEVDMVSEKIKSLLKDMADTMYKADGVGIAAPQIGILKRIVVIDAGEGRLDLINPVIVEQSGEQIEVEGCLSVTDVIGEVTRPDHVVVQALNAEGEKVTIEGHDLLARVLCHEIDHLEGILFKDKATRLIKKDQQ